MSIYTLPYNDNRKLSAHINAQELRCKGKTLHNITVNTELIDKTEKVLAVIANANNVQLTQVKVYISSGNRCKEHDIAVGGSGWGLHVVGKAFDFAVKCKNDYVSSKELACICQEIGFTGIGRINDTYIHADVGTLAEHGGKKWLGDETVKGGISGSIITEPMTYWNYYKINKEKYFPSSELSIERKIQKYLGVTVDGIIGPKSLSAMKSHELSSDYIKLLQELFNSRNYDCGIPDGLMNDKTSKGILSSALDNLFA